MATNTTIEQRTAAIEARNKLAEVKLRAGALAVRARALKDMQRLVRGYGGSRGGNANVTRTPGPVARYDSATRTRLRPGPRPRGGSAQSHLLLTRGLMTRDCQDLRRNSVVARALIKCDQDAVVRDGGIVTSTTADPVWNEACDRLWNCWANDEDTDDLGYCDVQHKRTFWQICRDIVQVWSTDGDVGINLVESGQLQVIEAERIVNPGMAPTGVVKNSKTGGDIVDGIEVNAAGTPMFYHVGQWDRNLQRVAGTTVPMPAEHFVFLLNPADYVRGQSRGEPALQATIPEIERLDNYIEKTGLAAEIATLFGLAIKTERPDLTKGAMEGGTDDQPTQTNTQAPNETELQAAALIHLKPGESVEQIKPEFPTTNYREYLLAQLMLIGADLRIPVCFAFLDATGLSWSNANALLAMCWPSVEAKQDELVNRLIRRVRNWKVRQWIEQGRLPENKEHDRCHIMMPGIPVLNFGDKVKGITEAVANNLMEQGQGTQELGTGRVEDIIAKNGKYRALEKEHGSEKPTMPGAKTQGAESTTESTEGTEKKKAEVEEEVEV